MRLTTDGSRNVTSSNAPNAYGVASYTANTANPYLWNGGVGYRTENLAPLGLPLNYSFQKVGDRYYDPTMGCFLTRDTELGQKPYAYCGGDPVNCTDPSGHRKKKQPPAPGQGTTNSAGSSNGTVIIISGNNNKSTINVGQGSTNVAIKGTGNSVTITGGGSGGAEKSEGGSLWGEVLKGGAGKAGEFFMDTIIKMFPKILPL